MLQWLQRPQPRDGVPVLLAIHWHSSGNALWSPTLLPPLLTSFLLLKLCGVLLQYVESWICSTSSQDNVVAFTPTRACSLSALPALVVMHARSVGRASNFRTHSLPSGSRYGIQI